jgi:hypothetical protein
VEKQKKNTEVTVEVGTEVTVEVGTEDDMVVTGMKGAE